MPKLSEETMPGDFDLDYTARIVRSRAWAVVTEEDVRNHVSRMRELFADGTLDGEWAQIADFSAVTSMTELSTAGVRRLARDNPWPATAVRAFVMPSPEVFGLGRMYQSMVGEASDTIGIVKTAASAEEWVARHRRDRIADVERVTHDDHS
ncbi:MAG: hypothetical protein ABMA00_17305 [Gemmatimonas sp.]